MSLLAGLLMLVLAYNLGEIEGLRYGEASATRNFERLAKRQASRSCRLVPIHAHIDCVERRIQASADFALKQQDLSLQQQSVSAAQWSAYVAFAALITGVIGLLWIKGSFDATRKSLEVSETAASASREIGEAQVRCYPMIDVAFVTIQQSSLNFILMIRNTGQSPCRWLSVGAKGALITDDPAIKVIGPDHTSIEAVKILIDRPALPDGFRDGLFIPSGQSTETSFSIYLSGEDINQHINHHPPKHGSIYVTFTLKWQDVFGNWFRDEFSWRSGLSDKVVIRAGTGVPLEYRGDVHPEQA